MTKSIKLNSKEIITRRKNYDTTINKYRKIIIAENVMSAKAVKMNQGSGYDLNQLYNTITQMMENRIIIKGMLQSLNMGITSFNIEEFKKTNNYNIFAAGEAKELLTFLKMIPTINPTEKSKKGLKGTGKKETFSSAKIASLIKKVQLDINKYDAALEAFQSTEIEIENAPESFTQDFAK